MSNKNLQRRKFIKAGAVGMAAFTIVPRHVLGKGHVAPSDKLRIAGIGAGGKGESDLAEFAMSPNVEIVAMADVDDRAAAKSRKAAAAVRAMHTVAQDVELPRKGLRSASVIPCDKRATGLWPIKRLELHERSVVWQQKGCCVVVGHAVGREVAGQRQARLDGP